MNYKIIVSPIASQNIEDALEYYIDKASKKVALDFLKEYRKTNSVQNDLKKKGSF